MGLTFVQSMGMDQAIPQYMRLTDDALSWDGSLIKTQV